MNRYLILFCFWLSSFLSSLDSAHAQIVPLENANLEFDSAVVHLTAVRPKLWDIDESTEHEILVWDAPGRPAIAVGGKMSMSQDCALAETFNKLPGETPWRLVFALDTIGKTGKSKQPSRIFAEIIESESGMLVKRNEYSISNHAPRSKIAVKRVSASSHKSGSGRPENAVDDDADTIWHSNWGTIEPAYPHHLTLDLGKPRTIRGFTYVPRKDRGNGTVADYELLVSDDGSQWQTVHAGRFNYQRGTNKQIVRLSKKAEGRFLRLRCLSSLRGDKYASCAEFKPDLKGGFEWNSSDDSMEGKAAATRHFLALDFEQSKRLKDVTVRFGANDRSGVVFDRIRLFYAPEFANQKMQGKANGHLGPDLLGAGSYGFNGLMIHGYPAIPVMKVLHNSPAAKAGLVKTDLVVGVAEQFLPDGNVEPGFAWFENSHEALLGRAAMNAYADNNQPQGRVRLKVLRGDELVDLFVHLNLPEQIGNADFLLDPKMLALLNEDLIENVLKTQMEDGSWKRNPIHTSLGGLALLSTQDQKYAVQIKACANWLLSRNAEPGTGFYWHPAFSGIFLAEYYLATGDKRVLPCMERMLRMMSSAFHTSKWGTETFGHGPRGLPYGNKSLVAVMVHVVLFETLAKRCGIKSEIYETLVPYIESAWSDPSQGGHGALGYNASYKDLGEFWSRTGLYSLALHMKGIRPDAQAAMAKIMHQRHPWFRNSHAYGEPGGALGWLALSQVNPNYFRDRFANYRWWFALAWERNHGLHFTIPHMGAPYMEGPVLINNAYAIVTNSDKKTLHVTGSKKRKWLEVSEIAIPVSDVMILTDANDRVSMRCKIPGPNIFYTLDGSTPTRQSQKFSKPFRIRAGTKVKAIAADKDAISKIAERHFGINKKAWSIVSATGNSDAEKAVKRAANAIDGDHLVGWITDVGEGAMGFPHAIVIDMGASDRPSKLVVGNLFREASAAKIKVAIAKSKKAEFETIAEFKTNEYSSKTEIPLANESRFRYLKIVFEESLSGSKDSVLMVGEIDLH